MSPTRAPWPRPSRAPFWVSRRSPSPPFPTPGDASRTPSSRRSPRKSPSRLLADGFPGGLAVNINVPPPPVKGLRVTALGEKHYDPEIVEKRDPRLRAYSWIGTGNAPRRGRPGTDIRAIAEGYISLSPLRKDPTDRQALRAGSLKGPGTARLSAWNRPLNPALLPCSAAGAAGLRSRPARWRWR